MKWSQAYPHIVEETVARAQDNAAARVLTVLEEGNDRLIKIIRAPQSHAKRLALRSTSISSGEMLLFGTSTPGLRMGLTYLPDYQAPNLHFAVYQLRNFTA